MPIMGDGSDIQREWTADQDGGRVGVVISDEHVMVFQEVGAERFDSRCTFQQFRARRSQEGRHVRHLIVRKLSTAVLEEVGAAVAEIVKVSGGRFPLPE